MVDTIIPLGKLPVPGMLRYSARPRLRSESGTWS
jgi:hypothetical protein